MANPIVENDADLSLTLTRILDAPRDAVFRAWVDPAHIARWIGPRSIKAEVDKMDARPGGAYRIVMHGPTGEAYTVRGIYRELAPPERLVFSWGWEDETSRPRHETVVTISFRAVGDKTEMTLRHEWFESKEARNNHDHGWSGSFDKLAEVLAGAPGMSIRASADDRLGTVVRPPDRLPLAALGSKSEPGIKPAPAPLRVQGESRDRSDAPVTAAETPICRKTATAGVATVLQYSRARGR